MTRTSPEARIGILYEHPLWFEPLFTELDRRGIPFERIDAATVSYDPEVTSLPYSVVVNRMSPSAWLRGRESSVFSTRNYLAYLEDIGMPVINGLRAFSYEISKARQITLASELGIRHPRARVITDPEEAVAAADGLEWPVLVKPNIGGSGAGMMSFESPTELGEAADAGKLEFGPDHTALVQEHLPAEGDAIVRIEFLDGDFLYAIRLLLVPGSFNLCPADYCELPGIADGVSGRGLPIEAYQPPGDAVRDAHRLLTATGADIGGVEYLINARDGKPYFYDVNALSNFVADAPDVIGFDPFVNFVDFIEQKASAPVKLRNLA
ncbi:MAG: RimK family alpha-L-glutamate ligase [Acidimicrobiia bacterium]